jgi:hypothetical protein
MPGTDTYGREGNESNREAYRAQGAPPVISRLFRHGRRIVGDLARPIPLSVPADPDRPWLRRRLKSGHDRAGRLAQPADGYTLYLITGGANVISATDPQAAFGTLKASPTSRPSRSFRSPCSSARSHRCGRRRT